MANITPSKAPGNYVGAIDIDWDFGPDVTKVAWTLNDLPPVLSEYIGYDQLTPPNPFIAVTQDGRGRVVYDGGFPKLMNRYWNGATTFAGLSGAHKYVHNVIKWTADPKKVAAGNNKFLVLGDTVSGDPYRLRATDERGMLTTLNGLFAIAGFVPTYRDPENYAPGKLDPTLSELEQYAGLMVIGSSFIQNNTAAMDRLTANGLRDIITFRRQGGGISLITDHGQVCNNIQEAYPLTKGPGYFALVNKIAVNFGAYFSGDYNRTPVNAGFLRNTYGDHPLYNGIPDSESIFAGDSESRVFVNSAPLINPSAMPTISLTTLGKNQINFLLELTDGSVETYTYLYTTGGEPIVQFTDLVGGLITYVDTGFANVTHLRSRIVGVDGLGTILGDIYLNGEPIGTIQYDQVNGSVDTWVGGVGESIKVNNNDVFTGQLREPFEYTNTVVVTRFQPDLTKALGYADLLQAIQTIPGLPPKRPATLFKNVYQYLDASMKKTPLGLGELLSILKKYFAR